jgi:hypothetical protein
MPDSSILRNSGKSNYFFTKKVEAFTKVPNFIKHIKGLAALSGITLEFRERNPKKSRHSVIDRLDPV